jgi:hypothetical protein
MRITTRDTTLGDITLKRAEFTAWEPKTTVPAGYIDIAAELTAGSKWACLLPGFYFSWRVFFALLAAS